MHFNNLPDDVLAHVLQAALPETKSQSEDVKSGLGLLSVCRRWREVALPMVYDTVVIDNYPKGLDKQECVDINTTLDLVVDAKCLHMVRRVVIDVCYHINPFQGLKAVIERMRGAAGEWAGVRRLKFGLHALDSADRVHHVPAADRVDGIASAGSALAALMPGLREIKFNNVENNIVTRPLYGQLAGFYADQLQVLHSRSPLFILQDRVFARLRDVDITGFYSGSLKCQLPRLNSEAVESLVLGELTANDMWSMFCADSDGCAIIFPRLTNLDLEYISVDMASPGQLPDERPWALQFPAVKRVRISCPGERCPSMENAAFSNRLESLDLSACMSMLPVFAGANVHVSQSLALSVRYKHDANNRRIGIANRMLEAADSCHSRKLEICSMNTISLDLVTYTGLTHLHFNGPTNADDVMELIRRLRHLVSLDISNLNLDVVQTDFSIPECTGHEPVAPLDTQISRLSVTFVTLDGSLELGAQILKYLLLKIPTLKSVNTQLVSVEQIQAFIDEYVQWYPHLANIKLM